ncbi:hypothetical protein SAMN05444401_3570 [Clostridium amylolyticum]|uniref:Uncharacterized protein n=1 Tax=Clostridium amylolyticum TaxID=1121298 RepID=A0A1M6L192_9CLOT|nr:hypothetical protein [Clostridium amylolyticum]SHJ64948.1 hypothetical protein SAMN05444401_3570 [Clostridium amylolyticum]
MSNKEEFMKYAEKRIREKKETKKKGKRGFELHCREHDKGKEEDQGMEIEGW